MVAQEPCFSVREPALQLRARVVPPDAAALAAEHARPPEQPQHLARREPEVVLARRAARIAYKRAGGK